MILRCEDCGLRFGGDFAYTRHISRREDRCRTPQELRARGLRRDRRGIWHQQRPTFQARLALAVRRGSREVEKAWPVASATEGPEDAQGAPPQQMQGVSDTSPWPPLTGELLLERQVIAE